MHRGGTKGGKGELIQHRCLLSQTKSSSPALGCTCINAIFFFLCNFTFELYRIFTFFFVFFFFLLAYIQDKLIHSSRKKKKLINNFIQHKNKSVAKRKKKPTDR